MQFNIGIQYYKDLIWQKSKAELRAEAARGYLGILWWILDPIIYMCVFYFVFSHLFERGDQNYVLFLLTGLIVWKWFHSSLITGSNSLMTNAGLMNQVYLPKIIFPLTVITVNTIKFLIVLLIFLLFFYFLTKGASSSWFLIPAIVLLQFILIVGIVSLLSSIIPFFPDLRIIIENIIMLMFFISGIFFDIETLPMETKHYFYLNPMATIISMYRNLIFDGSIPSIFTILIILSLSIGFFLLATIIYRRFDRVYPKIIN